MVSPGGEKRRTRLFVVESATQSAPPPSTQTLVTKLSFWAVSPDVVMEKLGWPTTPSAGAPFGLAAALSKRTTRLLPASATQRAPLESLKMPIGVVNCAAPKPLVVNVKLGWP